MARFLLFIVIALTVFSPAAFAEDYKPGTVGHLYENCRVVLENASKYTEIQETYCGAFSEGYFWGAMTSNRIPSIEPQPGPCAEEEKREWERINNRFCSNFPKIDDKKITTGDALKEATDIVTRWIEFEKRTHEGDPLKRGTLREVNKMIQPGPFCDSLTQSFPVQESPFTISPSLMKTNLADFMKAKATMTMKAKYERCQKDVAQAAGNSKEFLSTKCGAEISGYISGLHSTQHLQANRANLSSECKKPIDRLYKSLDVTQSMCVTYDTNPLRVAEIFLEKYPQIKDTGSEGGIGYFVIYRGFLCADKNSDQKSE